MLKYFILFSLLLSPSIAVSATYTISPAITMVDGNIFCGGSKCTSDDLIIVAGGERKGLTFKNFDGDGSYIRIRNENSNPDKQVRITQGHSGGRGYVNFDTCKYVDFDGSADPDLAYGFYILQAGETGYSTIRIYGKTDHLKIGYTHMEFTGGDDNSGADGILLYDTELDQNWTYDTMEIHHNRVDKPVYAGFYLGHNSPQAHNRPYIANFSVHDNIVLNSGGYGLTLKGIKGPEHSQIYNNTFGHCGLDGKSQSGLLASLKGFGVQYGYGPYDVDVYNNYTYNTYTMCFRLGELMSTGSFDLYDNVFVQCGVGGEGGAYDAGIATSPSTIANIYNNVVVKATGYGIRPGGLAGATSIYRNIVAEALDAVGIANENVTLGTGEDASVHYDDADDVGFVAWSDDGNYENDIFLIETNVTSEVIPVPQNFIEVSNSL